LTLLLFSDLMLDVGLLYFVDVIGANNTQASVAVTVWLGVGLLGFLPHLWSERDLDYLRFSAIIVLCLYPTWFQC